MKLHNPFDTNNAIVSSIAIILAIIAGTGVYIVWMDAILTKQWWAIWPPAVAAVIRVGWYMVKGR